MLNPRAHAGATNRERQSTWIAVSTTPHAGRDRTPAGLQHRCIDRSGFNPRAPRGVRRLPRSGKGTADCRFQPRPRGARRTAAGDGRFEQMFQSTRPTRGATCGRLAARHLCMVTFQSTRPRARRFVLRQLRCIGIVSIHAHAGRDTKAARSSVRVSSFHPRAPRGARPTLPSRTRQPSRKYAVAVSIHAHAGSHVRQRRRL